MSNKSLMRAAPGFPSLFDDFFKPWNEWFETGNMPARPATIPAVNIVENNGDYKVSLAAPGLAKEDFRIAIDNNMLTISAEKEDHKDEQEGRFTRKEYSYHSFSRSFTLPEHVNQDAIDARYENGVLQLILPKKQTTVLQNNAKQIEVK